MKTTRLKWTLRGWHAWNWQLALARVTGVKLLPVAGPVPVRVPGSVQGALRDAGIIPDWNVGTNSLATEWVEHRHWTFDVWDWMPRLVQICIRDGVRLGVRDGPETSSLRMFTESDSKTQTGVIWIFAKATTKTAVRWRVGLSKNGRKLATIEASGSQRELKLTAPEIQKWWPSRMGKQTLYDVTVELLHPSGRPCDAQSRRVGFPYVHWTSCEDAPRHAEPWILNLNGQPVFIAGVNWTPIRPKFADVTDAEIRARLKTYRELGFNLHPRFSRTPQASGIRFQNEAA